MATESLVIGIQPDTSRGARVITRDLAEIQRKARQVEGGTTRLSQVAERNFRTIGQASTRAGTSLNRNFSMIVQQAGFQVGDFAVQVAAGQGAMRAFTQQGSQLLGVFGPFGAVAGAAVAVVGAFSAGLFESAEEAQSLSERVDDLRFSAGGMEGAFRDLQEAAEGHSRALDAQRGTSDRWAAQLVSDTKEVFEARRQLLMQEIRIEEAGQQRREAQISELQVEAARVEARMEALRGIIRERETLPFASNVEPLREDISGLRERLTGIDGIRESLITLRSDATIAESAIDKMREAASLSFEEIAQSAEDSSSRTGGSIGRVAEETDKVTEAVRKMAIESATLGGVLSDMDPELVRLLDRLGLLTVEMQNGRVAAFELAEGSQAVIDRWRELEAQRGLAGAIEDAKKVSDELWREMRQDAERTGRIGEAAVQQIGDALGSAILRAESFEDALNNVARALLNIGFQQVSSSFSSALGGIVSSLFGPSHSAGTLGGLNVAVPNAKGNVFDRGSVIPFANGGIVTKPTLFPMANGAGLMGEAGPEAVLPLRRGRGGRLGVESAGGSDVHIEVINNTGAPVSEEREQTFDGERVRIVIGEIVAGEAQRPGSTLNRVLTARGAPAPLTRR